MVRNHCLDCVEKTLLIFEMFMCVHCILHFSVPSKSTDDLLGLNFFGSSASTPTGGGYNLPSPLSPMSDGAIHNTDTTHSSSSKLGL